jgi:hypothetical protein
VGDERFAAASIAADLDRDASRPHE